MAQALLQEHSSETLIELFFDSDSSEERDALFEAVAHRPEAAVGVFLQAVLAHDEDPFLRVSAARVILGKSDLSEPIAKQGRELLVAQLQHNDDELLFEEALEALLAYPMPGLFEKLEAIVQDEQQDIIQRKLSQVAMAQVDEARALEGCRALMQDSRHLGDYPLDLLSVMLSLMVQSGLDADRAAIFQAAQSVAGAAPAVEGDAGRREGNDNDDDDDGEDDEASRRQALGDMLAEAQSLVLAPLSEAQDL